MSDEHGLRWAGQYRSDGRPVAMIAGVPARDLTADEVAALPDGQAAELIASGLYKQPKSKPEKPAKDGD